jgi:hypothetical protein
MLASAACRICGRLSPVGAASQCTSSTKQLQLAAATSAHASSGVLAYFCTLRAPSSRCDCHLELFIINMWGAAAPPPLPGVFPPGRSAAA